MTGAQPLVSVIIPTYHRPELLGDAVASVLQQDLGADRFEVIVAVSDAASAEDLTAAEALATADDRVRMTVASRIGAGAARNAGMGVARGRLVAFIDDDCRARPGWLRAGVRRLADVELVQGRTVPAVSTEGRSFPYTIRVDRLSWQWEACNILVRRDAAERAGGFEEDWNPLGEGRSPWGEDFRWGWRVVRAGATFAFEPEAVVEHAVFDRTLGQHLEYQLRARYLPLILRDFPELRRIAYRRWFINRAQARLSASVTLLAGAGAARALGARRASAALALLGAVPLLPPLRGYVLHTLEEGAMLGAAAYGSMRYRRVLL